MLAAAVTQQSGSQIAPTIGQSLVHQFCKGLCGVFTEMCVVGELKTCSDKVYPSTLVECPSYMCVVLRTVDTSHPYDSTCATEVLLVTGGMRWVRSLYLGWWVQAV